MQDLGIQTLFIPKLIIEDRFRNPGRGYDFSDGGGGIPFARKYSGGAGQQPFSNRSSIGLIDRGVSHLRGFLALANRIILTGRYIRS
jgi:hypothetical protein